MAAASSWPLSGPWWLTGASRSDMWEVQRRQSRPAIVPCRRRIRVPGRDCQSPTCQQHTRGCVAQGRNDGNAPKWRRHPSRARSPMIDQRQHGEDGQNRCSCPGQFVPPCSPPPVLCRCPPSAVSCSQIREIRCSVSGPNLPSLWNADRASWRRGEVPNVPFEFSR
jgi:hypothetical protein